MKSKVIIEIVAAVAVLGGGYTVTRMDFIGTGKVGIVYNYKDGVQDKVLTPGMHFIAPMNKVKEFSTSNEILVLTGFARPQSVVGFDQERYDRRKRTYEHKNEQVAAVDNWIQNIEDGQTRYVFKAFYQQGLTWEKIAEKTGYSQSPDYPRLMIRDKYLMKEHIK